MITHSGGVISCSGGGLLPFPSWFCGAADGVSNRTQVSLDLIPLGYCNDSGPVRKVYIWTFRGFPAFNNTHWWITGWCTQCFDSCTPAPTLILCLFLRFICFDQALSEKRRAKMKSSFVGCSSYHDPAGLTHGKPNDLMHHRSLKCPWFLVVDAATGVNMNHHLQLFWGNIHWWILCV